MSLNRDQRKALKLNSSIPARVAAERGYRVEAKQTSASGRWVCLFCEHREGGLPCFVVCSINTEGLVDEHHFAVNEDENDEGLSYDDCRDKAKTTARDFYDQLVAQLQTVSTPVEDEPSGMKIISPDGSEDDYKFTN